MLPPATPCPHTRHMLPPTYQALDALLDHLGLRQEARRQLARHLADQLVVPQPLAALHDANNGGLDLGLAVLLHLLPGVCLLPLALSLQGGWGGGWGENGER